MPKKKKEEVAEDVTVEPITTGTTPSSEPTPTAPVKVQFDVYNVQGTLVRTYSVEQHGENAGELAQEYASKLGGRVI